VINNAQVPVLQIIRASYNDPSTGKPYLVRVESPFQDIGTETSTATGVTTGPPEHVWIEPYNYTGPGTAPIFQQRWAVWPKSDASYVIHTVCKMPVPDYDQWTRELTVQLRAHPVIADDVLARVFSGRDFHDNAMKSYYLMEAKNGVAKLQREDKLYRVEPAAMPYDEEDWRAEE
jgi:hypothetical protein